ncbi:hypothetical protein [Deinococcus sp.]|uniref:hypothetical protein n=1 Tax=Deinococcus sp. TaxID=47478 RepID=UPI0025E6DFC6|nr:hypothetical protein [Deinococcus sp.]
MYFASAERSKHLELFREFVEAVWRNRTPEEARQRWRELKRSAAALEALRALAYLASSPPPHLAGIIAAAGGPKLAQSAALPWLISLEREYREVYAELG